MIRGQIKWTLVSISHDNAVVRTITMKTKFGMSTI